jgi:hypothetical protein
MSITYKKVSETEPKYKKIIEMELTTEQLEAEKASFVNLNTDLNNKTNIYDEQVINNNQEITKIYNVLNKPLQVE